jgi:hypothetical protein
VGTPVPVLPCNTIDPYSLPALWSYLELKSGFTFERTDENISIYPDDDSTNSDGKGFTFTLPPPQIVHVPESTRLHFRNTRVQAWLCESTIEKKMHGNSLVHTVEDAMALCCVCEHDVKSSTILFGDPIRFKYDNSSENAHTLKQYLRFVLLDMQNNTVISFVDSCLFTIVRHKSSKNYSPPILKPIQHPVQNMVKRPTPSQYTEPPPRQPISPNLIQPTQRLAPVKVTSKPRHIINSQEISIVETLVNIFVNTNKTKEQVDRICDILQRIKNIASDSPATATRQSNPQKISESLNKKRKLQDALEECSDLVERDAKRVKRSHEQETQKSSPVTIQLAIGPPAPVLDPCLPLIYHISKHYDDYKMEPVVIIHIKNLDIYRIQDLNVKFGTVKIGPRDLLDIRPSGLKCRAPRRPFDEPQSVKITIQIQYAKKTIKFSLNDAYQYEDEHQPIDEDYFDDINDPIAPPPLDITIHQNEILTFVSAHIGRGKTIDMNMSSLSKLVLYSDIQRFDTKVDLIICKKDAASKKYGTLSATHFEWRIRMW